MEWRSDEAERRAAKAPHELFMINLAVFHLLLGPAAIVLLGGGLALLVPVSLSLLVIAFTWWRGRGLEHDAPWFVMVHWKLALRRYRILVLGYGLTTLILVAGSVVGMGAESQVSRDMLFTIFSRFGAMPTILTVFVCLVLESSALYQATGGQVPDKLAALFPPTAESA